MRSPSIAPAEQDKTVYLVMDDLGSNGRIWCERLTPPAPIWKPSPPIY